MTCRFVAIQPSARTTKPVPSVSSVRMVTTAGKPCAAMSAVDSTRGAGADATATGGGAAFARGCEEAAQPTRASKGSSRARIPRSVTRHRTPGRPDREHAAGQTPERRNRKVERAEGRKIRKRPSDLPTFLLTLSAGCFAAERDRLRRGAGEIHGASEGEGDGRGRQRGALRSLWAHGGPSRLP